MYFFSDQLLSILGKNYGTLNFELILILTSASLNVISGVAFSLYTSKGWIIHPAYTISKTFIIIIVSCFMFDLSTLNGVLYLNILFSVVAVLFDVIFGYYKILRLNALDEY